MGLEIKQSLRLSQQLVMTPQLQQAIKLLQLSRLELVDTINQELMENPLLEESEEIMTDAELSQADMPAESPVEAESLPPEDEFVAADLFSSVDATRQSGDGVDGPDVPQSSEGEALAGEMDEIRVDDQVKEDFDWENYLGEYSSATSSEESGFAEERETPSFEAVLTRSPSLRDHLLWQLRMADLTDAEQAVGEILVGSINPEGYFTDSVEDLAQLAKTDPATAERVILVIQQFDPLGVGARDLKECLLLQALELYPGHELVHDIIERHLEDLERRNYQVIAKKLGVSLDEVIEALDVIRRLEPKPGRSVSEEEPQYITPDIYVYKMDGEYVIVLNEDGLPKLRVNNFYKDSLAHGAAPEAKEYVQTKLRSAVWLIRSIHQRQRTIYKVTESIVNFQRNFFDRGIAHLRPLVLRDVAEDVGMHESTISRVTTNKYMHTPQGVFELKYFFNSGISRVDGGSVASESVKERIRSLIAGEDSNHPLSDQAIGDMLKKEDIDIARRTVAKYREMLGILPSSRRKRILGSMKGGHK